MPCRLSMITNDLMHVYNKASANTVRYSKLFFFKIEKLFSCKSNEHEVDDSKVTMYVYDFVYPFCSLHCHRGAKKLSPSKLAQKILINYEKTEPPEGNHISLSLRPHRGWRGICSVSALCSVDRPVSFGPCYLYLYSVVT